MTDIRSKSTMRTLKELFKSVGQNPKTVVTGLSSQFTSEKFRVGCVEAGWVTEYVDPETKITEGRLAGQLLKEYQKCRLSASELSLETVNQKREAYILSWRKEEEEEMNSFPCRVDEEESVRAKD